MATWRSPAFIPGGIAPMGRGKENLFFPSSFASTLLLNQPLLFSVALFTVQKLRKKFMLPVHIQDLFGGNLIKFKGKLYIVINVTKNVRNPYQYWLKARGYFERDSLEILLEEDAVVMKVVAPSTKLKVS